MIDKDFCMSSFLALRYVEKRGVDFCEQYHYKSPSLPPDEKRILVNSAAEIGQAINAQLDLLKQKYQKIGILLSGGMDSAILASYLPGCDAYTFRFMNGQFQSEAKADGVDLMIIGDASDYVFGGMDQLLSKDWKFDEFMKRCIYVEPEEALVNPVSVQYLFERYRRGDNIDFMKFYNISITEESYGSYANAFETADLPYYDPYELLKMAEPLDLRRIRSGESKYLIRELFSMRYPDIPVPEKLPMPRPVDEYFKNWAGPKRPEFRWNVAARPNS